MPFRLQIKVLGVPSTIEFGHCIDAVEAAIAAIKGGTGIPKGVYQGDKLVVTEQAIYAAWEESLAE